MATDERVRTKENVRFGIVKKPSDSKSLEVELDGVGTEIYSMNELESADLESPRLPVP